MNAPAGRRAELKAQVERYAPVAGVPKSLARAIGPVVDLAGEVDIAVDSIAVRRLLVELCEVRARHEAEPAPSPADHRRQLDEVAIAAAGVVGAITWRLADPVDPEANPNDPCPSTPAHRFDRRIS